MSKIILLSTYKEDLRAFESVLEGEISYSLLMRTPAQAKEQLEKKAAPQLILCSMSAAHPHFFDIFYWLQNSHTFGKIPIIYILDTGEAELISHLSIPPHALFLFRPVPQNRLFQSIREQLSAFPIEQLPISLATVENPVDFLRGKIRSVRIERELGRGGVGLVLLGYQETLDRQVAVKVLSPTSSLSTQDSERLQSEARAISRMKHPNVVNCYDAGFLDDGSFYIVMEYLSGKNLEELLESKGAFPQEEAARIILQAAQGLAAAHERDLIHRDIKPSNLIMAENGHVTITDFGLAIHNGGGRVTKTGVIMGTPYYLAPEQAVGHSLSRRVDIYSLGIVFYEMLTGRLPVEQENPFQAVIQRIQQPYFDPRDVAPLVHPQLADLVCRMTRTKSEERIDNCHTIVGILEGYLAHLEASTESSHPSLALQNVGSGASLSNLGAALAPSVSSTHQRGYPSTPSLQSAKSSALSHSISLDTLSSGRKSSSIFDPELGKKTGEAELARALEKALSDPEKVNRHATMSLSRRELQRAGSYSGMMASVPNKQSSMSKSQWSLSSESLQKAKEDQKDPKETEFQSILKLAKQAYIRRDYKAALQYYERCVTLQPDHKGCILNVEKLKKRLQLT